MIKKEFFIKEPIWAIKGVGLDVAELIDSDIVAVFVEYRDKRDDLVFPSVYLDSVANIRKYKCGIKMVRGKALVMVPLSIFMVKQTREEYETEHKRPKQEGGNKTEIAGEAGQ
jgi:hypothetical protein